VDQARAFELIIGVLLTLLTALSGWTLRTVLDLRSRLDVMEARNKVLLEGGDGKEGILGDIRYLRTRVGWIARAAHALRDRFYHVERHVHIEGMPPLELPPE
jgi:hypothetical protein